MSFAALKGKPNWKKFLEKSIEEAPMKFNVQAWRDELKIVEEDIRGLKKALRESGQPNVFPSTYHHMGQAKLWATKLYMLRAHVRGKIHAGKFDQLKQEEIIRPLLSLKKKFFVEEAVAAE